MISLTVVILTFVLIFGSLFLIYGMNKKDFYKRLRRVGAHPHRHPRVDPKKGFH